MTIEELMNKLGNAKAIEMAHSKYSKGEALKMITDKIKTAGLDVDGDYIDFLEKLQYESVYVDVKYVPLYCATAVAKLSWKEIEEGKDPIDHQEFCRFSTVFYGHDHDVKDRVNHLDILNVVDKDELKLKENTNADPNVLQIGTNNPDCDTSMLPAQSEVVMDAPVQFGEYYDLDTNYLCSKDEITKRVSDALEKTKSYKKLQKEKEKWSEIAKIDVKVVLVPIAYIEIGKHIQMVNCTNGAIDVIYEESKEITEQFRKAKLITYPMIITYGVLTIACFTIKFFTVDKNPVMWKNFPKYIFGNLFDILYWVLVIVGGVFALIAFPSRGNIVKRATKQKNTLSVTKIATRILIDINLLFVLMIILSFSK